MRGAIFLSLRVDHFEKGSTTENSRVVFPEDLCISIQ